MLWLRWPHFCARALGCVAGVTVILLAVLMALAQLLLPLLARHPAWVAAQLSQRIQRPVTFTFLEGRWTPSGPLFVMHGVTVGPAAGERGNMLQLPESELKLDFGGWLLPSRHLLNLYVRGLQLDLARDTAGWHINGIGVAGDANRQPFSPGRLSLDLWLEDLRVNVTDAIRGKQYTLLAPQLRLSRQGHQIRFGGLLQRGGVDTALRTAGRFREDGSSGQIWLGANDVRLKPLLDGIDMDGYTADHGHGRVSAWLDWRKGTVTGSLIRFDLDALEVTSPAGATASVPGLHGLAGLRQTKDGYDVRWAGDDGSALALSLHQPGGPQLSIGVAARELQLTPLLPWLALTPDLPPNLAQWIGGGHPRGDLSALALQWSHASGLGALYLTFKDLGIDPVGKLPGVGDLHGELRGDAEALSLELPDQPATLQFPHLFRQPFVLSKLSGTLAFWSQADGWHIGADTLDFVGAAYAGQARGEAILPAQGGAPFLDMYAKVDQADVPAAKLFWPSVLPPGTVAWLDRALVAGHVDQAQVLLRGDLADWPFHHNEGRFEAHAQISDLSFDYGEAWPHVEGVSAVVSFINGGMLIETSGGQSLGVKSDKAVALIPDFGAALLDLNAQGSGSGASLMNFVSKSPIGIHQADTLAKLNLGGTGSFDFHLSLPLKKVEDAQLSGTAQLHDADLSAPEWNLKLDKINGPLRFDLHGMQATALNAGYRGQPATLQLAIAGANSDPNTVLSAQLQGSYKVAELVQDYPSLEWLGQLADGRSDFSIGFAIAKVAGQTALAQALTIDSPMSGITLNLPAPLDKPALASMPLHMTMGLPVSGSDLQIALGQVMRGHFRLATADSKQPLAGSLAFGNQMPEVLPAMGLRIRGHASELDVGGWVQRAAAGGSSSGPELESIDVSTDQALLFGQTMGAMKIKATPQADRLSMDVDGGALVGNFSISTQDLNKRGITARLQRLYWPKSPPAPAGTAPPPATSASVPTGNPANTGINPAALPPLHLWVSDLRIGDAKLGEARLETWPTAHGQHIEQLSALSSQVQINASGDWNGSATDSHTQMKISFSAADLGAMLSALGFDGLVHGGKTQDQLDASWPGSPIALSLATMDGTLGIHVSDGRIPDASPGAGRLLGLVSLGELPRRLSLDFGDVFGKGFAFDSITGDFKLADGNATTSNMEIKGPAANIRISGRTGLRAKDYDQQMLEIPHVGNSLPIVGAVVGGPIGAAAGFAVQGLLGKGLNHVAIRRYHITGTWDKPVMTLVEKRDIPLKPPLAVPTLSPTPASTVVPPLAAPAPAGSAGNR